MLNKHLFSFGNLYIQNKNEKQLTKDQKIAMKMLLKNILEPFSKQFHKSLRKQQALSTLNIYQYINKNYKDLKQIVKYYIIAFLEDINWTKTQDKIIQEQNNLTNMNIIIQEIAKRYFCESQWYQKISHLKIFEYWYILDKYKKGYTCIQQINNFLQKDKYILKDRDVYILKNRLVNNYLLCDAIQQKIYQQNIEQLFSRVDVISFAGHYDKSIRNRSYRYQKIQNRIDNYYKQQLKICQIKQKQINIQKQQDYQDIITHRQNLQIKLSASHAIQQSNSKNKYKSQSKFHINIHPQILFNPENNIKQIRQNQIKNDNYLQEITNIKQKNNIKPPISTYSTTYRTKLKDQNKQNTKIIAQKQQIMAQIQLIRQQKMKNHIKLLKYI